MVLDELPSLPVTETRNTITSNIDVVSCAGKIRLLGQSDSQMFFGYSHLPSMFDDEILARMEAVCQSIARVMSNPSGRVIMSGCGTSGRIAFMVAREFNGYLEAVGHRPCFHYLISGGDESIVMSKELPEDDPHAGKRDLKRIESDAVVYIGISCGISAPYVLGQVAHSMVAPNHHSTVLIGFNPVELARDAKIEGWDEYSSCRQVAMGLASRMADHEASPGRYAVLNPVVGPESVTGSTRMKGGSCTRILLDALAARACALCGLGRVPIGGPSALPTAAGASEVPCIRDILGGYRACVGSFYSTVSARPFARVCEWAGASLRAKGHVYFLGAQEAGVMGVVDAAEMFDTYGEDPERVRGYVVGGWATAANVEGDIAATAAAHGSDGALHISMDHFRKTILPRLRPLDTLVAVLLSRPQHHSPCDGKLSLEDREVMDVLARARSMSEPPNTCVFTTAWTSEAMEHTATQHVQCAVPYPRVLESLDGSCAVFGPCVLAAKLFTNAVSTCAAIESGRVYENIMINVGVSNNKLFHRVMHILEQLTQCTREEARECLLKAIYRVDALTEEIEHKSIREHVEAATPVPLVVPTALLLLRGMRVDDACAALAKDPVPRNVMKQQHST